MTNIENRNRQPKGVSTGGQFATETKAEPQGVSVTAPSAVSELVELEPGDTVTYEGDRENFSYFHINRDYEGVYTAEGVVHENFSSAKPGYAENFTEEAWTQYINDRSDVIEKFIQDRYGDEYGSVYVGTPDGSHHDITFSIEIGEDAVTDDHAINRVWNETKGVQFINEMDPGTFGAENAGRMLAKKFEEYDAQKIEAEHAPSGVQTRGFTDGFVDALVQDQRDRAADDGLDDFNPETHDSNTLELDPDDERRSREVAEKFLDDNFGDIEAYANASGRDMESAGHDLYLTAAHHGSGFWDRISSTEADSVIGNRLTESVRREFTAADLEGSTELGDDGRIHIGWKLPVGAAA
ncbi:hypothetical protein LG293_17260 (plasmid) [Citricoccus nitrophenolicus]